jgi:Leucine rich repeat/Leucine rich repeat N-terminal domain
MFPTTVARLLLPLVVALIATRAAVVVNGGGSTPQVGPILGPAAAAAMAAGSTCPRVCFCNSPSRIVYCSRRGLMSIPDGIADDSLQLNLNGNSFQSTTVVRANLSRYSSLEHLYLSECQLEHIEIGAFVDLVALRWLDLSNNRLRSIRPDTFSGLRLQHLFLNGNRNIQVTLTG